MTGFIPVDKYSLPQLALVNYFSRDLGNVPGPISLLPIWYPSQSPY